MSFIGEDVRNEIPFKPYRPPKNPNDIKLKDLSFPSSRGNFK